MICFVILYVVWRRGAMDLCSLNPVVRSCRIYEKINKTEECAAYDARLIYIVSGDITVTAAGKKLGHLGAGELLYLPAGTPYRLKGQYLKAVVVAFDLDGGRGGYEEMAPTLVADFDKSAAYLPDIKPFDEVIRLSEMESLREPLGKMADIAVSKEGSYLAELSARLKLVLLRIAEATDEHALPARMVEALGEYIRENVGEEISNTEVGAIFGYHPFYISKVLKAAKGQTLRQYIISYRLKLSREMLLATGKTIAEIAEECGFTDASYFTKTFRAAFGKTPKEFRNEHKEDFI